MSERRLREGIPIPAALADGVRAIAARAEVDFLLA